MTRINLISLTRQGTALPISYTRGSTLYKIGHRAQSVHRMWSKHIDGFLVYINDRGNIKHIGAFNVYMNHCGTIPHVGVFVVYMKHYQRNVHNMLVVSLSIST